MSGERVFDCGHIFPDGLRCRLPAAAHQIPGMSHHFPTPEPSEVAETTAGERECYGPTEYVEEEHDCDGSDEHPLPCWPKCATRSAEPDAGEVDHIVTLHDKVTGLVWSCACGATGAGDRQRVIEAARQHALDWLAARVSAAETKARADERERIAKAIEAHAAAHLPTWLRSNYEEAASIARGDAR